MTATCQSSIFQILGCDFDCKVEFHLFFLNPVRTTRRGANRVIKSKFKQDLRVPGGCGAHESAHKHTTGWPISPKKEISLSGLYFYVVRHTLSASNKHCCFFCVSDKIIEPSTYLPFHTALVSMLNMISHIRQNCVYRRQVCFW